MRPGNRIASAAARLRPFPGPDWKSRVSRDGWALIAIGAAVLLANLPYLVGVADPNPLGPRSGLVSAITLGHAAGQPTIDPNNGFISQALGHRGTLDLFGLHLPWWNPYEGTGAPLAGELEGAPFFLFTWLTALANGQLYEHILFELIAGLATYRLVRRLDCSRVASGAAGIAFALNGTFAWFAYATVNPVAFLPLLLLGIERAYAAALTGSAGGWGMIALAGALSFYAGFPEVAYINTLMAIGWFLWRCGCLVRGASSTRRAHLARLAGKAGLGAVIAILVSTPLLISVLDYIARGYLGRHANGALGAMHIDPHGLSQLILPYVFGPIFGYADPGFVLTPIWSTDGGYLTTSLLLFAVWGLLAARPGRGRLGLRVGLLVWIVLVLARMYGEPPGLGAILGVLPGMSRTAFFRYATDALELSVTILAALGLDALGAERRPRRTLAMATGVLVVIGLAGLGAHPLAEALGPKFAHRPYYAGAIAWGALIAVAATAAAMLGGRLRRLGPRLAAVVMAVDVLFLFMVPEASAPQAVTLDTAPVAYLRQHLGLYRVFSLGPLQPNYGSYFGIAQLDVNDLPLPENFADFIHTRLDRFVDVGAFVGNNGGFRSPLLPTPTQELLRNLAGYRAASVRYVLTPRGSSLPASTFTPVFRSPATTIYSLARATPYFTAPGCAIAARSRTSVTVRCPRASQLVRRETFMPGWSATVNGRSTAIRQVDGLFQQVPLPPGTDRVSFDFAPPHIVWGYAAFLAGLLVAVAGGLSRRRRAPAQIHDRGAP